MRSPIFVLCLPLALLASACGKQAPNATEIEENGGVAAETAVDDADQRAQMLARQAEELNRQAAQATGTRRQELQDQANAAMSAALNVSRSGDADAARIDASAERAAQNAAGR